MQEKFKKEVFDGILSQLDDLLRVQPELFSTTEDFSNGCVVVLDAFEAKDVLVEHSELVVEGYPLPADAHSFIKLYIDQTVFVSTGAEEASELVEDFMKNLSDFVFFRFKDASQLKDMEDVLSAFGESSIWPPVYTMLNGSWYDTLAYLDEREELQEY